MATSGLLPGSARAEIPASHLDLVECPPVAALSTITADGYPQTSVVWCDLDGECVRVSTMRGFAKERNMRRDPRVTLLGYDPGQPLRYLEVRGTVIEMTEEGAVEHLDALASKYAGRPIHYFGDAIPSRFAETEVPVLCRIRPDRVVALQAADCDGTPPTRRSDQADRPAAARPDTALRIPASHIDLLTRPICGVATTMGRDGRPASSLVWVDTDGTNARFNTTLERRKGRDLLVDPKLSLLVVDPEDTGRFIQIRGDAELTVDGALEHLDALTRRYTTHPCFYGHVHPEAQRALETRVIVRIRARRITLDAIHR